jgi:hypothetical protein
MSSQRLSMHSKDQQTADVPPSISDLHCSSPSQSYGITYPTPNKQMRHKPLTLTLNLPILRLH